MPPNCIFEIDDIEELWMYSFKFDLIHMRMMVGTAADWPRCFKQCYEQVPILLSLYIEYHIYIYIYTLAYS
jgi:hypothetical protein